MISLNNHAHAELIASAAGCDFIPHKNSSISRETNGELLGGVIYQDYTGACVSAHIAGFKPNWINRDLLWAMFHYPFVQLNCKMILGFVPSYNTRALAFDYKLGFKYLTEVPEVFPNGDLLILRMKREDCKWLDIKPRQLSEG